MCLGIPGKVIEITEDAAMPMGIVDFGGVKRETCLAYVSDEVSVGNYVIVHAGFAISILDEKEARQSFELLREMGEHSGTEWMQDVARRSLDEQDAGAS
jgi:hydrogenase expression/formation protein HypC